MSDIVERLRKWSVFGYGYEASCDMKEAATAIEAQSANMANAARLLSEQTARIEQLEEANELMLTDIRRTDVDMLSFKARIEQLEAALKPLCCTCDRAASDECSRAEVNCAFWNARAALGEKE